MFAIESLIRNATKDKKRLSILVVNEGYEEYITLLAENLDHDFFLVEGAVKDVRQWLENDKPNNVYLCNSLQGMGQRYIDLIICFNRGQAYESAERISQVLHSPLIVVDFVSSQQKLPAPVASQVTFENPNILYMRNGEASIATTDFIGRSWTSNIPSLNYKINFPHKPYNMHDGKRGKVLIDKIIPKDYLNQLNIQPNSIYTADPSEASVYLHMWKHKTTMFFRAMSSKIPILILNDPEMSDVAENKSCIFIDRVDIFNSPDTLNSIMGFPDLQKIVNNAYASVVNNSEEEFTTKWENILHHVSNKCLVRF